MPTVWIFAMQPRYLSMFRSRLAGRVPRRGFTRAVALVVAPALIALAACSPNPTKTASYPGDFPDPSVIRAGAAYYAFATQGVGGHPAIQRLVSTDHEHWTVPSVPDALAALPRWADDTGTWAPDVTQIGSSYVMYYSVHEAGGRHCLSAALAASPANQFVDNSTKPMLCMPNGETIDPSAILGPYGLHYLVWKGPDARGVATIYSQRLTANGLGFVGPRAWLMKAKPGTWTSYNVEAPEFLFNQNRWFLFYSGGNYWSSKYAIGYATCSGPLGPCTDGTPKKPWVASHGAAIGPGGQSFFTDGSGTIFMAYHAWGNVQGYDKGGIRSLWIDQVGVLNGVPVFAM